MALDHALTAFIVALTPVLVALTALFVLAPHLFAALVIVIGAGLLNEAGGMRSMCRRIADRDQASCQEKSTGRKNAAAVMPASDELFM
ncbi:MAG TPA: hypothetical protein PKD49_09895 [Hyphomicrobium sp.]|nr:hypothetical protein [Hyphomicrobium sp.]